MFKLLFQELSHFNQGYYNSPVKSVALSNTQNNNKNNNKNNEDKNNNNKIIMRSL